MFRDTFVDEHEAEARFDEMIDRAINGEQITITRANFPVAILSPLIAPSPQRIPGIDADWVVIAPDFDAPLAEFNT